MIPVAGLSRSPHDSRINEMTGSMRSADITVRTVRFSGPDRLRSVCSPAKMGMSWEGTRPIPSELMIVAPRTPQLDKACQDRVDVIGGVEDSDQEVHGSMRQHGSSISSRVLSPKPRPLSGSINA